MKNRKINVKKSIFRILLLLVIIGGVIFLITKAFIKGADKSINENTKKYKNGTCTVFYPNNHEFRNYAKDICSDPKDENVYDYMMEPYGDYYLISYPDTGNTKFLMDKEYKPLVIDKLSNECRKVISDYLRYDMQKEELDDYYTIDFYEKTYYQNLDISNAKVSLNGINISVYLNEFDRTVTFPLFYVQDYLGINLGSNNAKYVKPHYVSKTRKTLVFTFNDGPSIQNSTKIIDTLYKYGANATFFIMGNRINQEAVDMIGDSIEKGNEYGSHTENAKDLTSLSEEEIYYEIMSPANVLAVGENSDEYKINGIDYNMKYYRAPLNKRNSTIDEISPLISIRWDVDSYDWSYRDGDKLYERLTKLEKDDALDRQIVILHDCYPETAETMVRIIKEFADKGYQFLNITEYLTLIGFDFSKDAY